MLVIGDTTEFDFIKRHKTEGLGPSNLDYTKSIFAHLTCVITPERVPLGILDLNFIIRTKESIGRKHRPERYKVPVEQRESQKWVRSLQKAKEMRAALGKDGPGLVVIFDREADDHRVLETAVNDRDDYALIIRAYRERKSSEKDSGIFIWEEVNAGTAATTMKVEVPLYKSHEKRTASLEVRYRSVELKPPRVRAPNAKANPIKVWAVSAIEVGAPEGVEPIRWTLYTTLEINGVSDAIECIKRYVARWTIEWVFRTTKTVCRAESRQFRTADGLKVSITLDVLVSVLILYLGHLSREAPDTPCTVIFDDLDWQALWRFRGVKVLPKEPPSIAEMAKAIAKIGGHLGRKHDGPPGPLPIARGLLKLAVIVESWLAFVK